MSEIVKPCVQAFLVCDTIIVDQLTGKKSLIGTFTHLWAPRFPCQHPQMGVYFCFTDAEGTYEYELQLIFLDEDKVIGKASLRPITINSRLEIHDLGVNLPSLVFPGPGRYEFRLYANGHFITHKDFNVIEQDRSGESKNT